MKTAVFWVCNAMQFGDSPMFGGTNQFHFSFSPASAHFFLGLLFNPEDGGDMFT
jgi:hypothetical protein